MTILYQDLEIERGADFPGPTDVGHWEWRTGEPDPGDLDPDTGEPRPPLVDLTGHSARLEFKVDPDGDAVELALVSGSGITLGGVLGTIVVHITYTQTAAIPRGSYSCTLDLTTPTSEKIRFLTGVVRVV